MASHSTAVTVADSEHLIQIGFQTIKFSLVCFLQME